MGTKPKRPSYDSVAIKYGTVRQQIVNVSSQKGGGNIRKSISTIISFPVIWVAKCTSSHRVGCSIG